MSDAPKPPFFEAPPPGPEPDAGPPLSQAPPPQTPFWGYSDLLLFAGLAIPCMLLGFACAKAFLYLFHVQTHIRALEVLAAQFAGYLFLFGALYLILRLQYGRPFWESLGWVEPPISYPLLVTAGAGTAIVATVLAYLIRTPTTMNPLMELLKDRISILAMALFGVTVGPMFEELAFRGFIQPLLVRSLGPAPGIIAASLPFGLLHLQEYGNSWRHAVVISIAGAMFGWMRHVTASTKASTIMHSAYNGFFFVLLLAQGRPEA